MSKFFFAISNHSQMLGGGEHSFLDLLSGCPDNWVPIASVGTDGPLAKKLRARSIQVEMTEMPPIRPWFLLKVLKCIKSYCHFCQKYNVSLIYANGSRAAFYGGLAGRILKIPIVWHCRIVTTDPIMDFILVKLVHQIVVNSQATAKRFHSNLRQKIAVVYNGIDIQYFKDRNHERPDFIGKDWKVILVVSRISKWKRHDLILSAFEDLARLDTRMHLMCIGAKDSSEPDWWSWLHERTRRSSFSKRIHWIGQVDDVRPWYQAASVLLLTSSNEPFGRVVVEAMSSGVPVVASRSGGVPEIINHGKDGILVVPENTQEIVEAIKKIIKNEELRDRITRNGINRAQFFDLPKHVAKMVDLFEDTVASN